MGKLKIEQAEREFKEAQDRLREIETAQSRTLQSGELSNRGVDVNHRKRGV